mmetsp:Transcript_4281/g.27281  ORF Transcript_4281/g.27281 Transcript_4281/m.27281 type:complete len:87 (+) Transcript_4281:410-670(+)
MRVAGSHGGRWTGRVEKTQRAKWNAMLVLGSENNGAIAIIPLDVGKTTVHVGVPAATVLGTIRCLLSLPPVNLRNSCSDSIVVQTL